MFEQVLEKLKEHNVLVSKATPDAYYQLYAPYKSKVIFKYDEFGVFGRGSLPNMKYVMTFGDVEKNKPSIRVGNFCEPAAKCSFLTGGEHLNHQVINNSLNHFKDIVAFLQKKNVAFQSNFSKGPITIGGNVTISNDVTILSGVTIGAGAVIGANALVTKDIPPFAIAVGQPAKVIKYRFDEETINDLLKIRWWDFKLAYLVNHFEKIQLLTDKVFRQEFMSQLDQSWYDNEQNYLIFKSQKLHEGASCEFIGAEVNGRFIKYNELPDEFKFFVQQVNAPEGSQIYLIKDIFKFSGLTEEAKVEASAV